MTRLDENRARTHSLHSGPVRIGDTSPTSPFGAIIRARCIRIFNARIEGKPATDVIADRQWLENDFIKAVQQRGAAIIRRGAFLRQNRRPTARSRSVQSIVNATPGDEWHSVARFVRTEVMASRKALFAHSRRDRMARKSASYRMCL